MESEKERWTMIAGSKIRNFSFAYTLFSEKVQRTSIGDVHANMQSCAMLFASHAQLRCSHVDTSYLCPPLRTNNELMTAERRDDELSSVEAYLE